MIIEKDLLTSLKYIYIPLLLGNEDVTVLVKKNNYILKGTKIGKTKEKNPAYLYANVSGVIRGITKKRCCNGKLVNCLIIENDWKEKRIANQTNNYFNDYVDVIYHSGLLELQNNVLLHENYQHLIKTMIINTIVYQNQLLYNEELLLSNIPLFLEIVDHLMELKKMKECFIVIPKNHKIKKKFNQFLGTYPRIKLFELSKIPIENQERILTKKIKGYRYHFSPIEKQIVIHSPFTLFSIYHTLKYSFPVMSKKIVIIMHRKKTIIDVKIGTEISLLLPLYHDYTIYFIYDCQRKKINNIQDMIVTEKLDAIELISNKKMYYTSNWS